MNIQDALQVFGMTGDVTQDEAKAQYRRLSSKYHPDRNPAGLQMMQAVNAAWDALQNAFAQGWNVTAKEGTSATYGDDLNDAINAIINLPDLEIEVCGSWVWVSGDTKTHKNTLKDAGYNFAFKKCAWYFRPANYKSSGRGRCSMDKIREIHGSQSVESKRRTAIPA